MKKTLIAIVFVCIQIFLTFKSILTFKNSAYNQMLFRIAPNLRLAFLFLAFIENV